MNAMIPGFADRLKTAAAAKKALIEKHRPKPTVTDPLFDQREALRAAELERVRQARAEAKIAAKQAAAESEAARRQAQADLDQAAIDARRSQIKERKALTKAEAKAKRDARYAARKARQA